MIDIAVPTKQRLAMAGDNLTVDVTTGHTRVTDSPLDRLRNAGKITYAQHAAGERYFANYYAGGLAPLGAVDYERPMVDGSSPKGESDYRMGALDSWNGSSRSLGNLRAVVDAVVLHEQPLEAAGRNLGWANRPQAVAAATERLRVGLDILARGYGLA